MDRMQAIAVAIGLPTCTTLGKKEKSVETYESNPEYVQVIGAWDGQDTGPLIDWLKDTDYPHRIQTEQLTKHQLAEDPDVQPRKILAILGHKMYQQATVEVGSLLVIRQDFTGEGYLTDMDSGYLDTGFRKTSS